METVEISVRRRTAGGKSAARRLRRDGVVPGIFYGPKRSAVSIAVGSEELEKKLLHVGGSHLIRLIEGDQDPELHDKMVLIREMQIHPVTGDVLHADFLEVDLSERLTVSVPLRFAGKAAGVTAGGILQPIMREIEVECLPTEIPEFIEVDVSALGIHEAVHASDLSLPEGIAIVGELTQTLVTVLPPTVEEAKPAAEVAEAAPAEGVAPEGAAGAPAPEPAAAPSGKKGGAEG